MKLGKITLNGKEYPLCFSLRVVKACGERYGGVGGIGEALTPQSDNEAEAIHVLDECLWLLTTMMDAAYRYNKRMEVDTPEPPTLDELLDTCGFDDVASLKGSLMGAIVETSERTVEVDNGPKKEETTTET